MHKFDRFRDKPSPVKKTHGVLKKAFQKDANDCFLVSNSLIHKQSFVRNNLLHHTDTELKGAFVVSH